jgi:hypothetical protein
MPDWITKLPWWIKFPAFLGGSLMSAFSAKFPDGLQSLGLYAGITLASLAILATAWHRVDVWRIGQGKPGLKVEHFIILGNCPGSLPGNLLPVTPGGEN